MHLSDDDDDNGDDDDDDDDDNGDDDGDGDGEDDADNDDDNDDDFFLFLPASRKSGWRPPSLSRCKKYVGYRPEHSVSS